MSQAALRILLVDDDEVDRLTVRRLLRVSGMPADVDEAVDATAGLQRLRDKTYDCGVFDFRMPGRDGLWLLKTARAEGLTCPVVMLTGQGDEETAVELMKAGAADYLPKNGLTAERFIQSIRNAARVHQAEAAANHSARLLEEERQRFRIALDAAHLGTWDLDPATGELKCDKRCSQMLGLPHDAKKPNVADLQLFHPEDSDRVITDALNALDIGSSGHFETEFRVASEANEEESWRRATGRAFAENGKTVRFIGILQDISARKQQQLLDAKHTAFQRRLIGIVSHDLRNPISAMMLSAATLSKRADADPKTVTVLKRIVGSGERASRLIRDLLDFTQASLVGGIPIQAQASDLNDVARQVVDEVRQAYPHRIVIFEPGADGKGEWDTDRVAQIIANLSINAVAYSPAESPVYVRSREEDGQVVIEVQNTGTPIASELLPLLFEPFRRGGDESRPGTGSLGLGLFIVDHLVRAHAGTVSVRSSVEEGTLFTVRLPRRLPS